MTASVFAASDPNADIDIPAVGTRVLAVITTHNRRPTMPDTKTTPAPTALHKGLRVLKCLPGHLVHGVSNQELARATGLSPSSVTRIVQTLIDEGLAQKLDSGRFAPGVRLAQMGLQTASEIDAASRRINELRQRIGAVAHY